MRSGTSKDPRGCKACRWTKTHSEPELDRRAKIKRVSMSVLNNFDHRPTAETTCTIPRRDIGQNARRGDQGTFSNFSLKRSAAIAFDTLKEDLHRRALHALSGVRTDFKLRNIGGGESTPALLSLPSDAHTHASKQAGKHTSTDSHLIPEEPSLSFSGGPAAARQQRAVPRVPPGHRGLKKGEAWCLAGAGASATRQKRAVPQVSTGRRGLGRCPGRRWACRGRRCLTRQIGGILQGAGQLPSSWRLPRGRCTDYAVCRRRRGYFKVGMDDCLVASAFASSFNGGLRPYTRRCANGRRKCLSGCRKQQKSVEKTVAAEGAILRLRK